MLTVFSAAVSWRRTLFLEAGVVISLVFLAASLEGVGWETPVSTKAGTEETPRAEEGTVSVSMAAISTSSLVNVNFLDISSGANT